MMSIEFKAIIYGDAGSGKSHFCCDFPKTYYIDTESLYKYPKFTDKIKTNGGNIFPVTSFEEVMEHVKGLIKDPRGYKTLVIDSVSNLYITACDNEAIRLASRSKSDSTGTEKGRNLIGPQNMVMRLANLLRGIDMHVIMTAWVKKEYQDDTEIGDAEDVFRRVRYLVGTRLHAYDVNGTKMVKIIKTRYNELKELEIMQLSYAEFEKRFGTECFTGKIVEPATATQLHELHCLLNELGTESGKMEQLLEAASKDFELTLKWIESAKTRIEEANKIKELNNETTSIIHE